MGDWKVKIKLFISIVLVILLSVSTLVVAKKPSDLPAQAYSKGQSEEFKMLQYEHFVEIYVQIYEKNDKEPRGILQILESIGR